jgi:hydroxymethylpyrimidine pyrophosphatase-like HAD family hydrolase
MLPELIVRMDQLAGQGRIIGIATGRPREDIDRILADRHITPGHPWPAFFVANERDVFFNTGGRFTPDAAWNNRLYNAEKTLVPHIRRHVSAWLERQSDRDDFYRYDDEATEDHRAVVALCGESMDRIVTAQDELNRAFAAGNLPVQVFHNRATLVFRHVEICKGRALLRAVAHFKIAPDCVLAIGDSENDTGMLNGTYGFQSACPANAEPAIQRQVLANVGRTASQPCGRGVLEILADV